MHPFVFLSLAVVFSIYYWSYTRFCPWYATVVRVPNPNRAIHIFTNLMILMMTATAASFVYNYVSSILIASVNSTAYELTKIQLETLTAELEWWIKSDPNCFTYFSWSLIYLSVYGLIEPFL